jgi:hypothetical protein
MVTAEQGKNKPADRGTQVRCVTVRFSSPVVTGDDHPMAIRIEEVSSGVFSCSLVRDGHEIWATSGMSEDQLIRHLREHGCHLTDIGDAFESATPGWVARQSDG